MASRMSEPVKMLLGGRSIADLQAGSAPAVSFREQWRRHAAFYLKVTEDGRLVLRCWTSGRFEPGWSLRAVMQPEAQGVGLQGRIRAPSEAIVIGLFGGLGVMMVVLAVAGASMHQTAAGFPLAGAVLFLASAILLIRRRGAAMSQRQAWAWQYLQSLGESAHGRPGRRRAGRSIS